VLNQYTIAGQDVYLHSSVVLFEGHNPPATISTCTNLHSSVVLFEELHLDKLYFSKIDLHSSVVLFEDVLLMRTLATMLKFTF